MRKRQKKKKNNLKALRELNRELLDRLRTSKSMYDGQARRCAAKERRLKMFRSRFISVIDSIQSQRISKSDTGWSMFYRRCPECGSHGASWDGEGEAYVDMDSLCSEDWCGACLGTGIRMSTRTLLSKHDQKIAGTF